MKFREMQSSMLFERGQLGYDTFRIPTVLALGDGCVLAFAEGRKNSGSDTGDIDIVSRRSEDGGRTFGELCVVMSGQGNTVGNPCPVLDRDTGTLFLLYNRNDADAEERMILRGQAKQRGVYVLQSADGGKNWEKERNITGEVSRANWTWYACGPCHAVQLANGRLVIPCNHAVLGDMEQEFGSYIAHVIYSDDHGKTWHVGQNVGEKTNESTLAALSDGTLLINMRSYHGQGCRALAISHDGGEHFEHMHLEPALPEPICQGSMLNVCADGKEVILFVNPAHKSERIRLTIHESTDGGATWQEDYVLTEGAAAYSDLADLGQRRLGVLYETGAQSPYERIVWTVLEY